MVNNMVYLVFVFKEWVFIWHLRSFIESLIRRLKKSYSTDYILQNIIKNCNTLTGQLKNKKFTNVSIKENMKIPNLPGIFLVHVHPFQKLSNHQM